MPVRVLVCLCALTCFAAGQQKDFSVPPTTRISGAPVEMKADPCFHSALDNSSAKIFQVSVAPHETTGLDIHRHDYIVLSLNKASFRVSNNTSSFPLEMGPGEMQVLQGGWPQQLTNTGDTPLQLVEVEVEHGIDPEHPLCGLAAAECTDGEFASNAFSSSTLFETRDVKLQRVDLEPGGTMPKRNYISHVLVALEDMRLTEQEEGKESREMQLKAGEAVWYEGSTETTLTNLGQQQAPIITIEFKR